MNEWAVGVDPSLVPDLPFLRTTAESDAGQGSYVDAFHTAVEALLDQWRRNYRARSSAAWMIDRSRVDPESKLLAALGADGERPTPAVSNAEEATTQLFGGNTVAQDITFVSGGTEHPSALCVRFSLGGAREIRLWFELETGFDPSPTAWDELKQACEILTPFLQHAYVIEQQARQIRQLQSYVDSDAEEDRGHGDSSSTVDLPDTSGIVQYHGLDSANPRMHEIFDSLEQIKDKDLSVLLVGETGTGKELFARAVHSAGDRASNPFEVIGCGSLSDTLLESELFGHRRGAFTGADRDHMGAFQRAHGGVVFLDEIADMTSQMQTKILRVLQEKRVRPVGSSEYIPVDVRVVSATRANLHEAVDRGEFREDLLYRLNVFGIDIPPLRDRPEDIAIHAERILGGLSAEYGSPRRLAESALAALGDHRWPGNVTELKSVLSRAYVKTTGRSISRRTVTELLAEGAATRFVEEGLYHDGESLVLRIPQHSEFNAIIGECERLVLVSSLRAHRGNKSQVTKQLGIPRQTLYNKIEKHGIEESEYA